MSPARKIEKKTALERINILLDTDSFVEIGHHVHHSCIDFGMDKKHAPYDGVITGLGLINNKPVAIYSQDFKIIGGSLGKKHGQKIVELIKRAIDIRCPIIGINDSGGARIQESINSLAGYGQIFYYNTLASGYIPQISIIAGPCAGGAVYSPALTDFVFVVDHISNMFVTGPKVIKQVLFQDVTSEELGGSEVHSKISGVAHFRFADEDSCFKDVKKLLSYIPHHYTPNHAFQLNNKLVKNGNEKKVDSIIPDASNKAYDVRDIITLVFDDESFYEIQKEFAMNVIIGFARIAANTVGIIANQPQCFAGVLDCDASDKTARFVRYCDSFNIPIVTFTDVPGFMPGLDQEQKGIIRHGAKILFAFSEATVPKINIIIRKSFGGAYIAMNSKHIGADFVFAWPNAEIAVMGAEGAVDILYGKLISSDPDPEKVRDEKIQEYKNTFMKPEFSAKDGYIDAIIKPSETRKYIYNSLAVYSNSRKEIVYKIPKKHGNIPL